jgi:flagellar basal body-associated protein FliL
MTDMPDKKKKHGEQSRPRWLIVVIVIALVFLCVLPICVITMLTLLGPSIGNVFSEIVVTLEAESIATEVGYNVIELWVKGLGSTPEPPLFP